MHNLNIENGKASLAVTREKPWHGLGTVLPEPFTSEEALEFGGLNFEVQKKILLTRVGDKRISVPGKFVNVRMDTLAPLGVVGNYYQVLQNAQAFDFFDMITGAGEAIYETAGCLGKGEVTFLCAKLPSYIKVPGDVVEMYAVLTNTHDGSRPLTAFFTPVKTVCNNTLNAGLATAKHKVVIRHTKDVKNRMQEASKVMGISNQYAKELELAFSVMSSKSITDGKADEMVQMILLTGDEMKALANGEKKAVSTRKENIMGQIMDYYFNDSTLDGIRGTQFGVYNAITGYFQNVKEYRTGDTKMINLVFEGADWKTQQKAFDICLR